VLGEITGVYLFHIALVDDEKGIFELAQLLGGIGR
jgi:hypothetical protein